VAPWLDAEGDTAAEGEALTVPEAEARGAAALTEDEEERRCLAARRSRAPPTWELREAAMARAAEGEGEEERERRQSVEVASLEVAAIAMALCRAPLPCLASPAWDGMGW
jgi:hypothetical protein